MFIFLNEHIFDFYSQQWKKKKEKSEDKLAESNVLNLEGNASGGNEHREGKCIWYS